MARKLRYSCWMTVKYQRGSASAKHQARTRFVSLLFDIFDAVLVETMSKELVADQSLVSDVVYLVLQELRMAKRCQWRRCSARCGKCYIGWFRVKNQA